MLRFVLHALHKLLEALFAADEGDPEKKLSL
jgi:hypothetical protein